MAVETHTRASEGRSSIDRRTLIKRAAAAGTVAWVAPLAVEALVNPAAASGTPGTFCFKYLAGAGLCTKTTLAAGDCIPGKSTAPATWPCTSPNTGLPFTFSCTGSPGVVNNCNVLVAEFKITSGSNCTFTHAGGQKTNNNCRSIFADNCTNGASGAVIRITDSGKTLSYYSCSATDTCDQPWANFTFVVTCT